MPGSARSIAMPVPGKMKDSMSAQPDLDVLGLFSTPVVVATLPLSDEANRALATTILAREGEGGGVRLSNLLGWQSEDDFERWSGAEGAMVLDCARALCDRLSGDRQGNRVAVPWAVNAWANVNRQGQGNEAHAHPGSFLSGCYYVDDGGIAEDPSLGGALRLIDPRGVAPAMYAPELAVALSGCATAGAAELIQPRRGQAVLFPSWLMHSVRPYLGTGTRISVAFNFWLPTNGGKDSR